MKKIYISFITCVILGFIYTNTVTAQNTAITDDDSYTPHSSAVLDVYSLSKGLLVPRLTTTQRTNISTPADGLLVYDTNLDAYYYFANSSWHSIDSPSLWSENNDTIFITGDGKRYGVGTASPVARLTVQGDATIAADEPLFEVKNSTGDVIFAVYENEVKVNFKETVKGVKGGFAVGGLTGTKGDPIEYMRITPDSVRIYINDTGTKGVKGGFAVGGLTGTKGGKDKYFLINDDSARIYLSDPAKGVKGGFAVGGLTGTKGGANYLDLTPDNYFIGHRAGLNTTGLYNSFFGFEAGFSNTTGNNNVFMGRNSGHSNLGGYSNLFIGNNSGYNNTTGYENTFIGLFAGYYNTSGRYNLALGSSAGSSNTDGFENVYLGFNAAPNSNASGNVAVGSWAGYTNTVGQNNTFLGMHAGWSSTGSTNIYVGYSAGGDGHNNIAIGGMAGIMNTGNNNVFMGHQAAATDTVGSSNVMIGYRAGYNVKYASNNVIIGNMSNFNGDSIYGNVVIGNYAGWSLAGSNKLAIDNSLTSLPLIYGDFATNDLIFNGDVNITGTLIGGKTAVYKTDIFENSYKLKPIETYLTEIKTLKHLPALQSIEDINANGYNYSQQMNGLTEELQKAYLYIEKLDTDINKLKAENNQLKDIVKRIENIEKHVLNK